jgi:hypothetical protein
MSLNVIFTLPNRRSSRISTTSDNTREIRIMILLERLFTPYFFKSSTTSDS